MIGLAVFGIIWLTLGAIAIRATIGATRRKRNGARP